MPVYNAAKKSLFDQNPSIDLDTDTIKVALLANTYTPDIDAHTFFSDVSADEISGTGYTAGGETLANATVTQDNTNDRAAFDADDVVWANATVTARYAVIYKDTGTPSTSPLIAYIDFGSDKSSSAADFTIQWNADGIFTLT